MHARLRLDIGWGDLAAGLGACLLARDPGAQARRVERLFAPQGAALATLSVRTGLDLYLAALGLPRGSQVLVSALTIPHMLAILERHGLEAVPFALDARTLGPAPGELERLATPRTRAVLFAHLFGQRAGLDDLAGLAARRGWLFWEDCAQAFTGDDWRGHPRADLALFSFGLIKNLTAINGGIALVRAPDVRERMRAFQAGRPLQRRTDFARRLVKAAVLKALSHPRIFERFVRRCQRRGEDLDRVLHAATRGFPGPDFLERLRRAPSAALLCLLERRLRAPQRSLAPARRAAGEALLGALGDKVQVYGAAAPVRTHWVFAVGVDEPARLVGLLRAAGFDATALSSLVAVAPTAGGEAPAMACELLERVVYVPLVPGLSARGRDELARILSDQEPTKELGPVRRADRAGARVRVKPRS
jgi:dTDP-4-amino-4,6-dideoxygalactose transaminase